jgi:hypothetical protein
LSVSLMWSLFFAISVVGSFYGQYLDKRYIG